MQQNNKNYETVDNHIHTYIILLIKCIMFRFKMKKYKYDIYPHILFSINMSFVTKIDVTDQSMNKIVDDHINRNFFEAAWANSNIS